MKEENNKRNIHRDIDNIVNELFELSSSGNHNFISDVTGESRNLIPQSKVFDNKLKIINEPPLEKVVEVPQRGFGYLAPGIDKEYLETIGLASCIGLYMEDKDNQLVVLAHLDRGGFLGRPTYKEAVEQILDYLTTRGLTDGNFNKVVILKSGQAGEEDVEELRSVLNTYGFNNIEIVNGPWTMDIVIDKDGKIYLVDPRTIRKRNEEETKRDICRIYSDDKLTCANEKEEKHEIYSGLLDHYHYVGPHGCAYGVRLPVNGNFTQEDLDELKRKLNESNQLSDIIKIKLEECSEGKYLEISAQGYPKYRDSEIREIINMIK
jgi:hypothetical protein